MNKRDWFLELKFREFRADYWEEFNEIFENDEGVIS